jgi:hypothetical protein
MTDSVNFANLYAYAVAKRVSRFDLARTPFFFWVVWHITSNRMLAHGSAPTREQAIAEVQRGYPTATKNKAEHAHYFHEQVEQQRWVEERAKVDPAEAAAWEVRTLTDRRIDGEERQRLLATKPTGEFVYMRQNWSPHPIIARENRFTFVAFNGLEPFRLSRQDLEVRGVAYSGLFSAFFYPESHVAQAKQHEAWRDGFFGRRGIAPIASNGDDLRALGLESSATVIDVKRAFRERAKKTHPDMGGDAAQFRALVERYERVMARMGGDA